MISRLELKRAALHLAVWLAVLAFCVAVWIAAVVVVKEMF